MGVIISFSESQICIETGYLIIKLHGLVFFILLLAFSEFDMFVNSNYGN